jgi:protein involved in polysaccharide export with SLBB domain
MDSREAEMLEEQTCPRGMKKGHKGCLKKKDIVRSMDATEVAPTAADAPPLPPPPSELELYFTKEREGEVSSKGQEGGSGLKLIQFGYDLFTASGAPFDPSEVSLVGPEYILGPGDEFVVTLWGLIDGHYKARVSPEGMVVLPKIGEVPVSGISYGGLKAHLERAFAKNYKNFQLSVSMAQLRGIQVFVVGSVQRPGSYPLHSLSTVFHALFASGGPTKAGSLRDIRVLRQGKVVAHLDLYDFLLKGDKSRDVRLQDQDTVFVPLIGPVVAASGEVNRPAIYELKGQATLKDVLDLAGGVRPTAYLARVQIERVQAHEAKAVLDFDLSPTGGKSVASGRSTTREQVLDTPIHSMDLVKVLPISPTVQGVVHLKGHVVRPGPYQLRSGMRIRDVVQSLGDLKPNAYMEAELTRYSFQGEKPSIEILPIDLAKALAGEVSHNVMLRNLDTLTVRPIPLSELNREVLVKGEVIRPGLYTVQRGERLSSLLRRAGGFTSRAYPKGAIFFRESVKAAQQAELQKLSALHSQRLSAEASALALGGLDKPQAEAQKEVLSVQKQAPEKFSAQVTLGRMVVRVDVPDKLEGTPNDLVLEPGDQLEIPSLPTTVSVLGSVRNPTALLYQEGVEPSEYIRAAGGLTSEADWEGGYLLKSDGSAIALYAAPAGFGSGGHRPFDVPRVEAGDAIVVPPRVEVRTRPLPMWQAVPDPSEAQATKKDEKK